MGVSGSSLDRPISIAGFSVVYVQSKLAGVPELSRIRSEWMMSSGHRP